MGFQVRLHRRRYSGFEGFKNGFVGESATEGVSGGLSDGL